MGIEAALIQNHGQRVGDYMLIIDDKNLRFGGSLRHSSSKRPVVKVKTSENHPSGAKAHTHLAAVTAPFGFAQGSFKAVPFQSPTFVPGC